MPNQIVPVLTCGAWLMAGAAFAQAPPAASQATTPAPTAVAPLTVQAAPGPVTVRKETREFVQTFAASTPAIDQIARWHDPVCIGVVGLVPEQAARVAARIQEVAEGVGMRALKPGCRANIEVVFTDQPQAFMDKVAANREEVLGYFHRHQLAALKTVTRPIQATWRRRLSRRTPPRSAAPPSISSPSRRLSTTRRTGGQRAAATVPISPIAW